MTIHRRHGEGVTGREIVPFPIPSSNLVTEEQLQIKLVTEHKWRRGNLLTRNFTCRWKQGTFTNSLKEKKNLNVGSLLETSWGHFHVLCCSQGHFFEVIPLDRGTLEWIQKLFCLLKPSIFCKLFYAGSIF